MGHISTVPAIPIRATVFKANANPGLTPQRRKQLAKGASTTTTTPRSNQEVTGRRPNAHHFRSVKRPFSAGPTPSRLPCSFDDLTPGCSTAWNNQVQDSAATINRAKSKGQEAVGTPHRPQSGVGSQRWSAIGRPHTALGLRRGRDHHDIFEARAADPGWGSGGASLSVRTPSAPEREEWGGWDDPTTNSWLKGFPRRFANEDAITPQTTPINSIDGEPRKFYGVSYKETIDEVYSELAINEENNLWFLGRTKLAEAKVLIQGKAKNNVRSRTEVILKCLSLDGLTRKQEGVQKTLRGFTVEVSFSPQRTRNMGGSSSVTVCSVQQFLKTTVSRLDTPLGPFREIPPLDQDGNYPEIGAIIGTTGQSDLYRVLLGSCKVAIANNGITVKLLQRGSGDGSQGMSATIAVPESRTHRSTPPGWHHPVGARKGPRPIVSKGNPHCVAEEASLEGNVRSKARGGGINNIHGKTAAIRGTLSNYWNTVAKRGFPKALNVTFSPRVSIPTPKAVAVDISGNESDH